LIPQHHIPITFPTSHRALDGNPAVAISTDNGRNQTSTAAEHMSRPIPEARSTALGDEREPCVCNSSFSHMTFDFISVALRTSQALVV